MGPEVIDLTAERLVRSVAGELLSVRAGECLCCYVMRMLDEFDCDWTLRFAKR